MNKITDKRDLFHVIKESYKNNFLFVFFLFAVSLQARDTTFLSEGFQQEIYIRSSLIDSSSIKITTSDSIELLGWSYDKNSGCLLIKNIPDSGILCTISYTEHYLHFPKTVTLYNKHFISSIDTLNMQNKFNIYEMKKAEELLVNGYKSFSISVDNNGALFLEQGLDIRIGGELRAGTELSAHLTDQGSSLENTTKEISEFDFIYLQLKNPSYTIVAGDQYISRQKSVFFNEQKKIKGISLSAGKKVIDIKAFGSLAGGTYTTQNIDCQEGIQGPYFLKGNGENGYIIPIGGTVKVKLNGKELQEAKDYSIDYDFGSITIGNNKLIRSNDLLKVEYEYKLFDYQQFLYGINAGFKSTDSSLKINGSFWINSDNKNNPIDISLSEKEKQLLKLTGDSSAYFSSETDVDPRDVPSYSQIYPLYNKVINELSDTFYVYSQYDPLYPENRNGYYQVWFIDAGDNKGEYILDTVIHSQIVFEIYVYKGKNSGNYTPLQKLPSPARKITGELSGELRKKNILLKTCLAGENIDKNTFSSENDIDNNSSAIRTSFTLGEKQKTRVWAFGSHDYASMNFSQALFSKYELLQSWNDTSENKEKSDAHYYSLSSGILPQSWLLTEVSFGQRIYDGIVFNSKYSNTTNVSIGETKIHYNGSCFDYKHNEQMKNSRINSISLFVPFKKITTEVSIGEEWHKNISTENNGSINGNIIGTFLPLQLNESFSLSSHRKGKSLLSTVDTGYNYLWEQAFNCKPVSQWNFKGNSGYSKEVIDKKADNTTLLINLENAISLSTVSFLQTYSTSFEKASSFVQIPVYAGKGLGTYMYDSIKKEFVYHIPGDWYMQEKEVFNESSDLRIRKSDISLKWSLEPLSRFKGILADLHWNGSLVLSEQIDANEMKVSSWFPGYYTIKNYKNSSFAKGKVKNAELSYRQDIQWRREKSKDAIINVFIVPSLKKIRTYYESAVETGLSYTHKISKFTIANETAYISVNHDDTIAYQDLQFKDLRSEFTEKYALIKLVSVYCKENVGITYQTENIDEKISLFQRNVMYYQLTPGILWDMEKIGNVDVSYTFSNVPLTSNKDYRIAQGFQSGVSHIISASAHINAGKNVQLNGLYRFEINHDYENIKTSNQVMSLEARIVF